LGNTICIGTDWLSKLGKGGGWNTFDIETEQKNNKTQKWEKIRFISC